MIEFFAQCEPAGRKSQRRPSIKPAATANGVLFVGPELGRIDRAAAEQGPESEEVGRRIGRLLTVLRFQTVVLTLIVVDMAARPTF